MSEPADSRRSMARIATISLLASFVLGFALGTWLQTVDVDDSPPMISYDRGILREGRVPSGHIALFEEYMFHNDRIRKDIGGLKSAYVVPDSVRMMAWQEIVSEATFVLVGEEGKGLLRLMATTEKNIEPYVEATWYGAIPFSENTSDR